MLCMLSELLRTNTRSKRLHYRSNRLYIKTHEDQSLPVIIIQDMTPVYVESSTTRIKRAQEQVISYKQNREQKL
jgi:hypothetical protein